MSEQGSCGYALQARGACPDLRGEFLSEQTTAPRVGRGGTGVNGRLQVTGQLIASGDKKKNPLRNDANGFANVLQSI